MASQFNIPRPRARKRAAGDEETQWVRFGLPEKMKGKRFIDVGCWEGRNCVEAVKRGAEQVVGVDLCTSDELRRNVEEYGFDFVEMDVFSEKWLALDSFDIVLCSGVLYHVENPLSLLFRLRRVTGELLVLETATYDSPDERPVMVLSPVDERRNASNWWFPNKPGVFEMLKACGFDEVVVQEEKRRTNSSRLCVHAKPVRLGSYERVLPRQPEVMSLEGGHRWHEVRRRRRAGRGKDGSAPQR